MNRRKGTWGIGLLGVAAVGLAIVLPAAARAGTDVTTFHGDALRTGWNSTETQLTPTEVAGKSFGLLRSLEVDDQIDAQPLVVSDQPIEGRTSVSDVVYVVTETNSIYAFDPNSGEQLLQVNVGAPVPRSMLPGGCLNNGQTIGITSTPVIDIAHETMYVVAYTLEDGAPTYRIHALNLRNLRDRVPPPVIKSAVNASSDPVRFDARVNRQRAGLVLANGNVYAAFASFCDLKTSSSRGWVMGWQQDSLKPMTARPFVDRKASGSPAWFLSSIWMSGAAPAADATGRLYMVTGNRIEVPNGAPPGEREMSESVVAISADLRYVSEYFTPAIRDELDAADQDFGSGGILVLPDQDGPVPHLATAAGKDGTLYLLDRDRMGGFTPNGPDKVVGKYPIGGCFCVQSYFIGKDGTPRIVSSGGTSVMVWKVRTSAEAGPTLEREIVSHPLNSGQFPGFMTTISSNGTENAVIWAVSHPPNDGPRTIMLHAFDAATATRLFSQAAGNWPNFDGTANVMPVVANGKVFVAAYRSLSIFGLRVPSKSLVSASPDGSPAIALPAVPAKADEQVARVAE